MRATLRQLLMQRRVDAPARDADEFLAVALAMTAISDRSAALATHADARDFRYHYIVTVRPTTPRWCAGSSPAARSCTAFASSLSERFSRFKGSGRVAVEDGGAVEPSGPYGHLEYKVRIDHRRGDKGHFDSYAGNDWVLFRARDLFPPVRLAYATRKDGVRPRSRARLLFHLPSGWKSAAAHPSAGADAYLLTTGRVLSRPSGWVALGNLQSSHQEIDDVMVRIARVPGSKLPADDVFAMLSDALPRMRKLFHRMPPEILIVSSGDPMWRGGLSAYHSLFLHGDGAAHPDKTRRSFRDVPSRLRSASAGRWVIEGLAGTLLELQRRSGRSARVRQGPQLFRKYGLWASLDHREDNAATNNSAPLVMPALDQRIQRVTPPAKDPRRRGHRDLEPGGWIDNAGFRQAAQRSPVKPEVLFYVSAARSARRVRRLTPASPADSRLSACPRTADQRNRRNRCRADQSARARFHATHTHRRPLVAGPPRCRDRRGGSSGNVSAIVAAAGSIRRRSRSIQPPSGRDARLLQDAGDARRRAWCRRWLHQRVAGAQRRSEQLVFAQNNKFILERFAEQPWSERLKKPVMKNVVRVDREFDDPLPPEAHDLDAVFIVLFYHDTVWMKTDRAKMNHAVFQALKPGGIYAVIDHSAPAGSGLDDVESLHRIDEQTLRKEIEDAGFKLAAEADFLRNPSDPRDWNDSPRAAAERRGTSDRFVLEFVKPAK